MFKDECLKKEKFFIIILLNLFIGTLNISKYNDNFRNCCTQMCHTKYDYDWSHYRDQT